MYIRQLSSAALLLAVTAACGGGAPGAPTAPTALSSPAATAGATILGTVNAVNSMLAAGTGAAAGSLTVTVAGTNVSTNVGSSGQFVLNGVPPGNIQLNFSGPGVNATLSLSGVEESETITIVVKINGSSAELETESHEDDEKLELNGIVSGLTGSASSFQFRVGGSGGRLVNGDAGTEFYGDGNRSDDFSDLDNGDRVEVKAELRDGAAYAKRIHINGNSRDDDDDDGDDEEDDEEDDDSDDDDDEDDEEVEGSISALGGSCPSLTFTVRASTKVQTSGTTKFKGVACSALRNGDKVKAEGSVQSGVLMAREVKKS